VRPLSWIAEMIDEIKVMSSAIATAGITTKMMLEIKPNFFPVSSDMLIPQAYFLQVWDKAFD
jgi:hypothetical protein